MGALLRRFGEEDAVVRNDPHRIPADVSEPAHERATVPRLELVEPAAVEQAAENLMHVVRLASGSGNNPTDLFRRMKRLLRRAQRRVHGLGDVELGDHAAGNAQRVRLILGVVVRDARGLAMDVGASQVLGRYVLARSRLHERGTAEKNRAVAFHDDGLV